MPHARQIYTALNPYFVIDRRISPGERHPGFVAGVRQMQTQSTMLCNPFNKRCCGSGRQHCGTPAAGDAATGGNMAGSIGTQHPQLLTYTVVRSSHTLLPIGNGIMCDDSHHQASTGGWSAHGLMLHLVVLTEYLLSPRIADDDRGLQYKDMKLEDVLQGGNGVFRLDRVHRESAGDFVRDPTDRHVEAFEVSGELYRTWALSIIKEQKEAACCTANDEYRGACTALAEEHTCTCDIGALVDCCTTWAEPEDDMYDELLHPFRFSERQRALVEVAEVIAPLQRQQPRRQRNQKYRKWQTNCRAGRRVVFFDVAAREGSVRPSSHFHQGGGVAASVRDISKEWRPAAADSPLLVGYINEELGDVLEGEMAEGPNGVFRLLRVHREIGAKPATVADGTPAAQERLRALHHVVVTGVDPGQVLAFSVVTALGQRWSARTPRILQQIRPQRAMA
ncbi:hypothetical protein JKP88DRAFT_249265 [Tribonema minus]|uniref:Uncharacterized protein n=1 Tax=Tribonema minus TaxID=303371 RepID=A0A835YUN5_9STRA|nr:hypothetical protein JKP88DRAFT_249265 [Tribonema minus]